MWISKTSEEIPIKINSPRPIHQSSLDPFSCRFSFRSLKRKGGSLNARREGFINDSRFKYRGFVREICKKKAVCTCVHARYRPCLHKRWWNFLKGVNSAWRARKPKGMKRGFPVIEHHGSTSKNSLHVSLHKSSLAKPRNSRNFNCLFGRSFRDSTRVSPACKRQVMIW